MRQAIITDAMVIAGMTLLGYALAFTYEYGYASYFSIPRAFIVVSASQVIWAVGAILTLALFVLLIANGIFVTLPDSLKKGYVGIRLAAHAPFILLLLGYFLLFGLNWKHYPRTIVFWGLLLFSATAWDFVFALIPKKGDRKSYAQRLEDLDARDSTGPDLTHHLLRRTGIFPLWLVIYLFVALAWAHALGYRTGLTQKDFLMDTGTGAVIFAVYGDTVISTVRDDSTDTYGRELIITKVSSSAPQRWRRESLQLTLWSYSDQGNTTKPVGPRHRSEIAPIQPLHPDSATSSP